MRRAPQVAFPDSLRTVARLMVQSEIRTLPVYDEGQLRGFVTEDDIIHEAVRGRWGDDKVTEIFTKRVVVVDDEELASC